MSEAASGEAHAPAGIAPAFTYRSDPVQVMPASQIK